MKKIGLLMILMVATITACSDDLSSVNVDTKSPSQVAADVLVANATKSLVDQMVSTNVNRNIFRLVAQQWTETTYTDEANYDLTTRDINGALWTILYRNVLKDLKEAKRILAERPQGGLSPEQIANQDAMISVLEVYTWHVLVDTFGDIPYSEALDLENASPVYDDDAAIYADLVVRLDEAISKFSPGAGTFGEADYLYEGDVEGWMRFANSLKLRMALRYADVDDTKAASMANEAIEAGVIETQVNNADMPYLATSPNTNPLWTDLVQSGRLDFVAANTLVDIMNELEDPRRDDYFDENLDTYKGGIYGANGNTHSNSTIYSELLTDPELEGTLLDLAEVEFLRAEAAARGYTTESAEEHYAKGITASIVFWGGTEEEAAAYIATPEVSYNAAKWKELIGTQKWIALYNRGFEAWSSWRKLEYPVLANAGQSGLPVPLRFTYPTTEATLNGANYTAAGSAIGGDEQQTPVFWDVN